MKLVVGLVSALISIAATQSADAKCGTPHWVGTPNGASIPQTGTLYVYDEALSHAELKHRGGPIVRQTRLDNNVIKLDYASQADELELADDDEPTILNPHATWKPPAAAPRVIQYWHQVSSWTCSSADLLWLQVDQPTAAFRVVWEAKDRPARQFVFPARTGANHVSALPLGKIDCGSTTIDPAELAAGGRLTLFAIRFDGSEVAVSGLPATIATTQMPTTEDGIARSIGFPLGTERTAPLPPTDHDWPFHLFLLLLIPAAALLWVAVKDRSVKAVI